ncbi:hypothetical protein QBC40DRAFT_255333 [Triangularia verruculosa]|uniref:Uncharacterized protein n=1 Tax=Triangularia verruculosa TaxID=2587418 RepID=A0AAN6XFJ8_9PEZI|nr:hypothetical protein QBC40DRAFT_255333 [Triangularia verruculosa]
MCEDETGGAFWCNDSNTTKTKLWRELAEAAGEIFFQCSFGGIRTQGQLHIGEDSRVIVTHPIPFRQACNLNYNDTLKTRGGFEGIWPEDLEDPYPKHAAQKRHSRPQLVPPQAPTAGLFPKVSRPLGIECSSPIGRRADRDDTRQLYDDAMNEYKRGKMCTLGPKQCMNLRCNGATAAFFWCNDSTEKRTKQCWEPLDLGWQVMNDCERWGETGGTNHDGDERVFVFRPSDGKCELKYETVEK